MFLVLTICEIVFCNVNVEGDNCIERAMHGGPFVTSKDWWSSHPSNTVVFPHSLLGHRWSSDVCCVHDVLPLETILTYGSDRLFCF